MDHVQNPIYRATVFWASSTQYAAQSMQPTLLFSCSVYVNKFVCYVYSSVNKNFKYAQVICSMIILKKHELIQAREQNALLEKLCSDQQKNVNGSH